VIFAGGGTGGHVYPGLCVANTLQSEVAAAGGALEMLYIGIRGRVDEEIVPAEGIAFRAISAGALRVSSPLTFAGNALRLAWGVGQSTWILLRFKPDAVFATGGYASVPVGVAARMLRRPLVVFLPDVTPGWAVRLLSQLATKMTTTSERALAYLPAKKTVVVGYPVRDEFWTLDRVTARTRLGLPLDAKVLLAMAGSLGARKINDAIWAALPQLLGRCDVLHLTGAADESAANEQRTKLTPEQQARYHVRGYMNEVPAALVAADLLVARSGASTLGELPAAGTPAVLVPGEYEGWSQAPNAEFLQAEGAAVMLRNSELDRLPATVLELLGDDTRLGAMRTAAKRLARPNAARDLARVLMEAAA
jgi:UDP-N-acetylglucosamine--N-acetylmuramyl-(pentapeptide) pyrophosphoryl-undecaprenol N-acetylglucosamine transferase